MSRNLSSAYHALCTASLTTGASDTLAFKLNGICHFRNISGAIWEDNISMANEEIAILFKVNLAKQLSLPNRLAVLLLQREEQVAQTHIHILRYCCKFYI